jgi:hypothetical protein
VEHVTPTSHDGEDDESNLALACRACNLKKLDHLCGHDEVTGVNVALFNPRQDVWEEHFRVDDACNIVGLTPVGRATVARLQMNSPVQLEARRQWQKLGLFP